MALEYLPSEEAVSWASRTVDAYPDAQAIVLTHHYLDPDRSRGRSAVDRRGGEELWNEFIKGKSNITAVICGHNSSHPLAGYRTDAGEAGNPIHQILIDTVYASPTGGWMGLLKFRPSRGTMEMSYTPSVIGSYPKAPTYSLPWPGASRG